MAKNHNGVELMVKPASKKVALRELREYHTAMAGNPKGYIEFVVAKVEST